jgi:beta-lactam-binding protein with PASTA domain
MAFNFSLTIPEGMSKLKQDSRGQASLQVVVKNVSGRALDGRLVPISLPKGTPGVVEKGWLKVDKPDSHFDVGKEETFTVRLSVPSNAAAGDYSFRLDAVWVDQPDQADSSSAIGFTVAAKEKKETSILVWLIPLLVVVVIGLGVGIWLALRPTGQPATGQLVPDLHGQTVSDAVKILSSVNLTLDQNSVQAVDTTKPEEADKILNQTPDAGKNATKGQAVQVSVGTLKVIVPQVTGHPFHEAFLILGEQKLTIGQITTVANPSYTGGIVFEQSPAPQQVVKTGTAVDVHVTPQMITVPSVVGQTLGNAILNLRGLTVTSFTGDTTKTVMAQNPQANSSVPVGSSVTLTFPIAIYCGGVNCIYGGAFARTLVLQQALRARDLQQKGVPPQ